MNCTQCYSYYEVGAEDAITCPFCGSNPSRKPYDEKKEREQSDAKTLGITDARLLRETPRWEKAGSVLRK